MLLFVKKSTIIEGKHQHLMGSFHPRRFTTLPQFMQQLKSRFSNPLLTTHSDII